MAGRLRTEKGQLGLLQEIQGLCGQTMPVSERFKMRLKSVDSGIERLQDLQEEAQHRPFPRQP